MDNAGNLTLNDIAEIKFNTEDQFGASITPTLILSNIHIYKDGGIIQRASTSGITLILDHDGNIGSHIILIDTSDNSDPGFYTAGSNYSIKIITMIVDGQTVNRFIGDFSIQNRYMRGTDGANIVIPDPAGTAPTAIEIRQEMDNNSTRLLAIFEDTDFLQKIEGGDWELVSPDILYFYEEGTNISPGVGTVIAVFKCFDLAGGATIKNIARVKRIT